MPSKRREGNTNNSLTGIRMFPNSLLPAVVVVYRLNSLRRILCSVLQPTLLFSPYFFLDIRT